MNRLFALLPLVFSLCAQEFEVLDQFGRRLNERGITLVDWDGYMANPAIRISIRAKTPAKASLSATNPRIYFNRDLSITPQGGTLFISIFPDRDGEDEQHELRIVAGTNVTVVPIHVIDQDRPHTNSFQIKVDYSQDKTGFFDDAAKRAMVQQVVDDWAFFIDDMKLERVPAGAESTFIWPPDRFANAHEITNARAYTGYLLYAYGFHSAALRSGGEGSHAGGVQRSNGVALGLRRSGAFEAETAGNYNSLGWFLTKSDNDWARTSNLRVETNDFYSIAHHEIGHALFFNVAHPAFTRFKFAGHIDTPEIRAYLGHPARIDASDHFALETDPASLHGAFGNDYGGNAPRSRWIITKLDLLCAKALGYAIRPTSAFVPLTVDSTSIAAGRVGQTYRAQLLAHGGIPDYFFAITKGTLPPGLVLDSFTSVISGTPTSEGDYDCEIQTRDSGPNETPCVTELHIKTQ
jgi:hypothetical protein